MKQALPATPITAIHLSTISLRLKLGIAVTSAELLGRWQYPDMNAATDYAEMNVTDLYYWAFKCKHPIRKTEKGEDLENLLMTDKNVIGLPQGFITDKSITLGAGGDLLQADGLRHSKDRLFENVSDLLFGQTISYANFESPVTNQPLVEEVISDKAPPTECCSRSQFDTLTSYKGKYFDVLNTANNHTFDMGLEGIEITLSAFKAANILDVGTNASPAEWGRGKILIENGIKLGFTSATFGLNGHIVPSEESYRINTSALLSKYCEPDLILSKRQIDDLRTRGCDFIVATLHWGYEFEHFPRKKQIDAARALVEYGADAVLCHHPHVIQPVEYYRTQRDPNRVAVIAYSLGSLTWGYTAPHIALSMILNMKLAKGNFQGKLITYIEAANITPIFRSVFYENDLVISQLERLENYLDSPNSRHSRKYIRRIEDIARLVLG